MTAPSPIAVQYEYEADYLNGEDWLPLPVVSIAPSVDADRVPYAMATMTLTAIDEATFTALDPRAFDPERIGQVRWRIRQLDLNGEPLGYLPRVGANTDEYAIMHIRTVTRTLESVTLTLHGAETLLSDKLCMFRLDGPVVATNRLLVDWILELVIARSRPGAEFPARIVAADTHAESILNRRAWEAVIRFGSSYLQAIETELNSYGVRLIDAWGLTWYAASRGLPPTYDNAPTVVKLGTYTTDATHTLADDVDPSITELEQTVSRDGQWADAVVVSGEYGDGAFVNKWQQMAGLGKFNLSLWDISDAIPALDRQTRGRVISIERASPTGNIAESIASRAIVRGHGLTVSSRLRFDVLPGMTLEAHMREQTLTATIVAVNWAPETGTMTMRAQSASSAPAISANELQQSEPNAVSAAISAATQKVTTDLESRIQATQSQRGTDIAQAVRNRKWSDA